MAEPADSAFGQKFLQLDPLRMVIDHEGFSHRNLMPVTRGNKLVDIVGLECNRLFAQDMLACFSRLEAPFDMLRGRQRYIDAVDSVAGQKFFIGTECQRCTETVGDGACPRQVAACNGMNNAIFGRAKRWNYLRDANLGS